MNLKKSALCIMLSIALGASNLQAFLGEALFFGSMISCFFFKQKPQQNSLDDMISKKIENYQRQREACQSCLSSFISTEERARYEDLHTRSEQAYLNRLVQSATQLQASPQYANNNTEIIRAAEQQANQAHAQIHEQCRHAQSERVQSERLDTQTQNNVPAPLNLWGRDRLYIVYNNKTDNNETRRDDMRRINRRRS